MEETVQGWLAWTGREMLFPVTTMSARSPLLLSTDAYDALAPVYRAYAAVRHPYLRAIDDIVISRVRRAESLLDAGTGDGSRALALGRALGAERIVLLEPSPGMRLQCPSGQEVWPHKMEDIPSGLPPFALITCLWNVLGHVQDASHRVPALLRLRSLLAPGGLIFLDVTHRYNAAAYGWAKTAARVFHDLVIRSEKNGDVIVSWQAGDRLIQTQSHVFTHAEMRALFHAAGLRPIQRWVVRYDTGAVCRLPFSGHLLYQLVLA